MNIERAISRAKELKAQGYSYRKMAKVLNQEGFRTTRGKPLTDNSVYYYANAYAEKHHIDPVKTPQTGKPAPQKRADLAAPIERVTASSLKETSRKKVLEIILDDLMEG